MHPDLPNFSKTVAYLRKSRADGEESVEEVLARHERMIQDYALRTWNAPLPESRIFREVQSGETIASRPVIRELISRIQNKEIEGILVVDLQRLSRGDLLDVGELSRLFLISKCKILTPQKVFSLSDEYDKKFFEMELMHGNDYLEYVKKIMSRGRRQSVIEGNYIGSRRPFGYERVFVDKKPTLKIIPEEAEIVRLIFALYTGPELLGPTLISDRLNELGLSSLRMDHWTPQAVRNIVQSDIYIGRLHWDKRKIVREYRDGNVVETTPVAETYITAQGRHEPIIDLDTWEKAVEAAKTRAHPSARMDRRSIVNPLSGLMYCSCCGYAMSYKVCYDHKSHAPLPPIFICTSRTVRCPTRGAPIRDVLTVLSETLRKALNELPEGEEEDPAKVDPAEQRRKILTDEIAELTQQRERLFDFLERGIYDEQTFIRRSETLKEKIEAAETSLREAEKKKKAASDARQFRTSLEKCIECLSDPDASAASANYLLKQIVKRIDYQREKSPLRKWDPTPINLSVTFRD